MIRYGKSSGPLLALKRSFFDDNDALLDERLRLAAVYTAQPKRAACKACDGPLGAADFAKHGVEYAVCGRCGHLNGGHEDTDAFCAAVYTEDGGEDYARAYCAQSAKAYRDRVRDIYSPKAEFLAEALRERGEDPFSLRYADLGAGSGYFVAALIEAGIETVRGLEVSEAQVALANRMVPGGRVRRHALEEVASLAAGLEAEVVSMIGVLEHLQRPRDMLAALRDNRSVRYLYLSLPLLSPCVFVEMAFADVMPRQLTGGHTHLYTDSSIDWTCREFGFRRVAEWWFGTDMVDLYRSIWVRLAKSQGTGAMQEAWTEMFAPALDAMQLELDRRRLASEVHLLLAVER